MPSGASCKSGVCDCADGYTYVGGRCRILNGLNGTCETVKRQEIGSYRKKREMNFFHYRIMIAFSVMTANQLPVSTMFVNVLTVIILGVETYVVVNQ